jgi:endonuclease/exonuclease/phosphatase family metal-dependent hydrolase
VVKVVTINILFEMEKWAQRRELLVEGLAAQQADFIGLQEVKLPEDNSAWLAQQLNMPYVQLVPYKGLDDKGFPIAEAQFSAAIPSRNRTPWTCKIRDG